jgi:hypothetical protein
LHFIPFVRNEETIGVNLVDFSVEYFEILLTDFRFSTLSDFIFKYIHTSFFLNHGRQIYLRDYEMYSIVEMKRNSNKFYAFRKEGSKRLKTFEMQSHSIPFKVELHVRDALTFGWLA